MQIDKLVVKQTYPNEKIIRKIHFKRNQLNLIVDITKNIPQDSGNSVGKTTTVKIIDLCLGGSSINSLYRDNDTHSDNKDIKEFLKFNKVTADLFLSSEKDSVVITRELFPMGKKYIDGVLYPKEEFRSRLKKILFNSNTSKPSVRQLLGRFVRLDNQQLENVIHYLKGRNSKESYEAIHLSLLGAENEDTINKMMEYDNKIREYRKDLNRYKRNNNITSLESLNQKLNIVKKELKEKGNQREKIDYINDYKEELEKKSEVISELDQIFSEIESVKFDVNMTKKSLSSIEKDRSNIDIDSLRSLYKEVSEKVVKIDKQFEDLVIFHNNMINNRIDFIKRQLDNKIELLDNLLDKQDILLNEKQKLSKNLVDENLLSDLNTINVKIDNLNVQKGEINKLISIYKSYSDKIQDYTDKLNNLETRKNDYIKTKVMKFNEFFSKYSKILYGESYYLVYNEDWKNEPVGSLSSNPFLIDNVSGNMGTGKKRGLIIAFDLAYLDYTYEENICAPQFIIHDKLENTHINQLETIFNLCANIKGQYIVPILKERIDKIDEKTIKQATVLELSQDKKFFKI
nr:MAG TPA: chromosome segregation ATPase [Caudoviricetes sp.]